MTLPAFVKMHRYAIDNYAHRRAPQLKRLNDKERALWVLNEEPLYLWARRAGVKI